MTASLNARRPLLIYGSVAIALGCIFVPMALMRLVDPDEGFYVIAARLVAEGKLPYRDFLYPQMPGVPYIYGAWMKAVGVSWHAARLLSSIFAILSGVLLSMHVARVTGRIRFGLLAVFLYSLSSLSLGWLTSVRTYSLSTCMLLCAYVAIYHAGSRARYALGGLFLGVAVDARLQFVIVVPLFVVAIVTATGASEKRRSRLWCFLAGLGTSLAPNLWLVARYPDQYIFNNIGYHAIRSASGLVGDAEQKQEVLGQLVGIGSTNIVFSLQFASLLVLCIGLAALCLARRERVPLSLSVATLLLFVNILPTPAYAHYFSTASHFLVISGTLFLHKLRELYERRGARHAPALRYLVLLSAAIYGSLGLFEMYRYATWNGMLGIGPPTDAVSWRIETINAVGAIVDQESEHPWALAWWPGYFLESRTSILPRMENQFGIRVSEALAADQLTTYRIITNAAIVDTLAGATVNVAVLDGWVHGTDRTFYRRMLRRYGYVPRRKVGAVEIYTWDETAETGDVIIRRDEETPGQK